MLVRDDNLIKKLHPTILTALDRAQVLDRLSQSDLIPKDEFVQQEKSVPNTGTNTNPSGDPNSLLGSFGSIKELVPIIAIAGIAFWAMR